MSERRTIYYTDKEAIVDLFVGKSVRKVDEYTLQLNDGTLLEIEPNQGCGGCSSGNYELDYLNECENIITNVEVKETSEGPDKWDTTDHFEIFVYSGHQKINLLCVSGWDNGYYGQGYWINVKKAS